MQQDRVETEPLAYHALQPVSDKPAVPVLLEPWTTKRSQMHSTVSIRTPANQSWPSIASKAQRGPRQRHAAFRAGVAVARAAKRFGAPRAWRQPVR